MARYAGGEGTPLGRWAAWFEGLPRALRAHLWPHLLEHALAGAGRLAGDSWHDASTSAREELLAALAGLAGSTTREAALAVELAARTDRALRDPAVREAWLARGASAAAEEAALGRSLTWLRAVDAWGELRRRRLADRRIGRWCTKEADRFMQRARVD